MPRAGLRIDAGFCTRARCLQRVGARFRASLVQLRSRFAPLTAPLFRACGRTASRPRQAWLHNRKETTMSNEQNTKALPTHRIYSVSRNGEKKATWQEIGAAWPHKDGKGFNLQF